ncbi:MAG TPA: FtsX-like permease family protein [Spirochaetota bacterium]|nr:FtsX-like permease family protein [Spirochaetota bacterium]
METMLSLRFIKEVRKNKNISGSSLVVVIVIALGIIFYISAVSIMNGYIYGIMKISFEIKSFHIDMNASYNYDSSVAMKNAFLKDKRVLFASVYRESKVLLSANGKNTGILYFRENDENIFKEDIGLDKSLTLVEGEKNLSENNILISSKTAKKLKVRLNDHVFVFLFSDNIESKLVVKRLKIAGIFTTGFVELDEQLAYIGKKTGDSIFKDKLKYSAFVKLKNYKDVGKVADDFSHFGIYGLSTWEENNYNDLTALYFEKNIIAFIVILVLFVAILNILTTIYITVLEKNQEIGILKAVGFSPPNITLVFLLYGIFLGVTGIVFGVVLGIFVMLYLNEILKFSVAIINFFNETIYNALSLFIVQEKPRYIEIFSKDFYLDKIYTDISSGEIIFITLVVMLLSIGASVIPAIKAGNIKPNEVVRNG